MKMLLRIVLRLLLWSLPVLFVLAIGQLWPKPVRELRVPIGRMRLLNGNRGLHDRWLTNQPVVVFAEVSVTFSNVHWYNIGSKRPGVYLTLYDHVTFKECSFYYCDPAISEQ